MTRRIYRDPDMRAMYDLLVDAWLRESELTWPRERSGHLFDRSGERQRDLYGRAFWTGFDGLPDFGRLPGDRRTYFPARAAGIDCAKEARRRAREPRQ